jgi:hypothetical protein
MIKRKLPFLEKGRYLPFFEIFSDKDRDGKGKREADEQGKK